MDEITIDDFHRVQILVGTVRAARPNAKARRPALLLEVDLGPHGVRTTSAQITDGYTPEELHGRQVLVVANLPPRRVAGVKSEVLLLGAVPDGDAGVVLVAPDAPVPDGSRVL